MKISVFLIYRLLRKSSHVPSMICLQDDKKRANKLAL
jgi:hypothetical protein